MRLSKTEEKAKQLLIAEGLAKKKDIVRHYPDFYVASTRQFYEVKTIHHRKASGKRRAWLNMVQFNEGQYIDFQKINPIILIYESTKAEKPIIKIPFNELMQSKTLPFNILIIHQKYEMRS